MIYKIFKQFVKQKKIELSDILRRDSIGYMLGSIIALLMIVNMTLYETYILYICVASFSLMLFPFYVIGFNRWLCDNWKLAKYRANMPQGDSGEKNINFYV